MFGNCIAMFASVAKSCDTLSDDALVSMSSEMRRMNRIALYSQWK